MSPLASFAIDLCRANPTSEPVLPSSLLAPLLAYVPAGKLMLAIGVRDFEARMALEKTLSPRQHRCIAGATKLQIFIRVLFGVLLLWFAWAVLQPIWEASGHSTSIDKFGQWGDSFGGFNALVAALGFSAVAYNAWLQQKAFALQQDQLQRTIEDQHRQRFESQFISLLNLLRSLREDVKFRFSADYRASLNPDDDDDTLYEGQNAFRYAWHEVRLHIDFRSTPNDIGNIYLKYVHKRFEGNLGPYFRMVYTILTMVEADPVLNDREKHRFGNLLRSQLTSYELILHGLNGLAPSVSKDFSKLITRFHLLKYMPKGERYKLLSRCYSEEAFATRD